MAGTTYAWRWQSFGGLQMLVTDGGGAQVVLLIGRKGFETRDPESGRLRPLKPDTDVVARTIAAAPLLLVAAYQLAEVRPENWNDGADPEQAAAWSALDAAIAVAKGN